MLGFTVCLAFKRGFAFCFCSLSLSLFLSLSFSLSLSLSLSLSISLFVFLEGSEAQRWAERPSLTLTLPLYIWLVFFQLC